MKNREAKKIVVKCVSSKNYKGDLKNDLRSNRFLPGVGKTFSIMSTELVLMECEPEDAAFTGPNTSIELLLDDVRDEDSGKSIFDGIIPELLDEKQKIVMELLDKKFDGEDIPVPQVIFFTGPPSTSKSEILGAIKKKAECKGYTVVYTDGPGIMGKYIGDVADFFGRFQDDIDEKFVLIIDEVDAICGERNRGIGGGFMHLMESVTSLNMVLDKVIKKGGHAFLASNADEIAIDDAIRNRSLVVKRERISDEQLKIAVDLFSQNYSLNEETVGEIKKMDLKDFREINMATRLRACGLDHQKTLVFMDKERKRKKKIELVYVG